VLSQHKLPPAPTLAYGEHPDQVANLHLPASGDPPFPTVVLVHGGFWRARWDRTTTTPLARDLAGRGFAAWNVEYRRTGTAGGGWPGTLLDVAAAVDHLAGIDEVDGARTVAVGHSAGGQLALWLAGRHRLPAGAPGASPRVTLRGAVALAGVCDLERGHRAALGDGAVAAFLGGAPDVVPERYDGASPAALVPLGVAQVLVHGDRDEIVPLDQSEVYAGQAREAGDPVELVVPAEADHFDVIDPAHEAWAAVVARLPALCGHAG
jgi:acetyl esterase/lipase